MKSYTLLILYQKLKGTMFDGEGMFKSELGQQLHVLYSQPSSKCKGILSRRNSNSDTRQHISYKREKQPDYSYEKHFMRSHQPQYSLKPKCNLSKSKNIGRCEEAAVKEMFGDSRGRFTKLKR